MVLVNLSSTWSWAESTVFSLDSGNEVVVNNISRDGFRGLQSLSDPETKNVVGHYMFYKNDHGLQVVFFDDNLQETNRVGLPSSSGSRVGVACFNGTSLASVVYDSPGTFRVFSLSTDGTIKANESFSYSSQFSSIEMFPSVADDGFFLLSQISNGSVTGYQVLKLDGELHTVWDQKRFPEKGYLMADAAMSLDGQLVVVQRESKEINMFGNDVVQPDLVCFDGASGDLLFNSPLFDKDYLAIPNQLLRDRDGNLVIAGEYYEGQRIKTSNSDGVFFKKLSASGDVISYNRSSWKQGIQKQLAKTKLKLTGKNKVYFHYLAQTDDGGYQVIAETFATSAGRKILSTGLALLGGDYEKIANNANSLTYQAALLSGRYLGEPTENEAPVTISAQDFLILHFDQEGQLEEVSKIEKEYTKIFVYHPYMYLGGLKLARMINEYGFMDFAFCLKQSESDQVILVANCAYASKKHLGIVSIRKGESQTVRRIPINEIGVTDDGRKPSLVNAAPGANGTMVVYYLIKSDESGKEEMHMYKVDINEDKL